MIDVKMTDGTIVQMDPSYVVATPLLFWGGVFLWGINGVRWVLTHPVFWKRSLQSIAFALHWSKELSPKKAEQYLLWRRGWNAKRYADKYRRDALRITAASDIPHSQQVSSGFRISLPCFWVGSSISHYVVGSGLDGYVRWVTTNVMNTFTTIRYLIKRMTKPWPCICSRAMQLSSNQHQVRHTVVCCDVQRQLNTFEQVAPSAIYWKSI